MMEPRIAELPEQTFIGKCITMSLAADRTRELWQSFMPHQYKIANPIGSELYSIENYSETFFTHFDPTNEFEKWAAVQVSDGQDPPAGMAFMTIPEGLYAVFQYKGKSSEAYKVYQYIYNDWLPHSGYALDSRPHFAKMGAKYINDDPQSEEELWIPIKHIL